MVWIHVFDFRLVDEVTFEKTFIRIFEVALKKHIYMIGPFQFFREFSVLNAVCHGNVFLILWIESRYFFTDLVYVFHVSINLAV